MVGRRELVDGGFVSTLMPHRLSLPRLARTAGMNLPFTLLRFAKQKAGNLTRFTITADRCHASVVADTAILPVLASCLWHCTVGVQVAGKYSHRFKAMAHHPLGCLSPVVGGSPRALARSAERKLQSRDMMRYGRY